MLIQNAQKQNQRNRSTNDHHQTRTTEPLSEPNTIKRNINVVKGRRSRMALMDIFQCNGGHFCWELHIFGCGGEGCLQLVFNVAQHSFLLISIFAPYWMCCESILWNKLFTFWLPALSPFYSIIYAQFNRRGFALYNKVGSVKQTQLSLFLEDSAKLHPYERGR